MPDTTDLIQASYVTAVGAVVGFLPVQPYARRITQIVLKGPSRSTFKLYKGSKIEPSMQLSATPTGGGADNTYDTTRDGAALMIGAGEQVMGVWSGGATASGQTGTATVRSAYGAGIF
ncbi:MAG: hypothetical protein ACM30G_04095 [Micromonosporaceae bacterium]